MKLLLLIILTIISAGCASKSYESWNEGTYVEYCDNRLTDEYCQNISKEEYERFIEALDNERYDN